MPQSKKSFDNFDCWSSNTETDSVGENNYSLDALISLKIEFVVYNFYSNSIIIVHQYKKLWKEPLEQARGLKFWLLSLPDGSWTTTPATWHKFRFERTKTNSQKNSLVSEA